MADLSAWAAVYAAGLSTILAGFQVYNWLADRGHLLVEIRPRAFQNPQSTKVVGIVLQVSNVGKRPMSVVGWGYKSRKEREPHWVKKVTEGTLLQEGQVDTFEILMGKLCPSVDITYFFVEDHTGKLHRSGRRLWSRIRKLYPWPLPDEVQS